ncbi:MAG TPA: non-homologous end-joining DNA ligase [Actinomycetota bacterium]|nr:non-homologous end-joining DNA ligase [Actinomycetota bacterium]
MDARGDGQGVSPRAGRRWLDELPRDLRALVRRSPHPDWLTPMAATLTQDRFSHPGWIFERKLDGIRCLAFKKAGRVRLLSRNALPQNAAYPHIAEAVGAQEVEDLVLDGEVVATRGGESGFKLLRGAGGPRATVALHVFDMPHLEGHDLTRLPLLQRKALLEAIVRFDARIRPVDRVVGDGESLYHRACDEGWEGVIAKRADSVYVQKRSPDWLKMKCEATQELVVGGFTDPRRSRVGFGALLVGHYDGDDFVFAGKVGTGFDNRLLVELRDRLGRLQIPKPPFTMGAGIPRAAVWVRPEVVVQVAFTEWTVHGKLRHPRFLGLREDKRPREVVRKGP